MMDWRPVTSFDAAAEDFDDLSVWRQAAEELVEAIELDDATTVADVCCGTGACALAVAARYRSATTTGFDLSPAMLLRARQAAVAEGMPHLQFVLKDALELSASPGFDVVLCGFGAFMFSDPVAFLRTMGRNLSPGGKLAISVWGHNAFEPLRSVYGGVLREVTGRRLPASPWTSMATPQLLESTLRRAGLTVDRIVERPAISRAHGSDELWRVILGTRLRTTLLGLAPEILDELREQFRWTTRELPPLDESRNYAIARLAA